MQKTKAATRELGQGQVTTITWEIDQKERERILDLIHYAIANGFKPGRDIFKLKKNVPYKALYQGVTSFFSRKKTLVDSTLVLPKKVIFDDKGTPYVIINSASKANGEFGSYRQAQNLLTGEIVGVKTQKVNWFGLKQVQKENAIQNLLGMQKGVSSYKVKWFLPSYVCYTFQPHIKGRTLNAYAATLETLTEKYGNDYDRILSKLSYLSNPMTRIELERYQSPDFACLVSISALLHLKHLHNRKILHLDLNSNNIMIGNDFSISTIIDFGISKQMKENENYIKCLPRVFGNFVVPEVMNKLKNDDSLLKRIINFLRGKYYHRFTQQDDMYSLGYSLKIKGMVNILKQSTNPAHLNLADVLLSLTNPNKDNRPQNLDEVFKKINLCFGIAPANKKIITASDQLLTFFVNQHAKATNLSRTDTPLCIKI